MLAAVKAMKIQEVILKAVSKQNLWTEASEIIGVSYRTMKRGSLVMRPVATTVFLIGA